MLPLRQQFIRQNHIADAKRGRDGLRERVHVDDTAQIVHALHRGDDAPEKRYSES